ncbi:MAG: calcium/proton exchanger [Chloroflexi bacterium]|nr:MAG: calcium/proton exchanger [Anaerolineaceae bacterium 4572_32.2]RLC72841.1 MAG: calcium/proton exchanger [Chloroflexota bacterium]RLC84308.1 MAG: calcium/proton exchanger [Chloroflexota bacterium]HEY72056.1 calcium/proton exchanger [Thermoflexia bacterium]
MKSLYALLVFVPVSLVSKYLGGPALLTFAAAALGVAPLAAIMGRATENLAAHTGPRVGGFLNATFGNAAELIITFFAIRAGLLDLVKASIIGSIIGNLLLVVGLSVLAGGLRNGQQRFDRVRAGLDSTMLILAIIALGVPSLFSHAIEMVNHDAVEYLSLGVAAAMMAVYGLGLVYSFTAPNPPAHSPDDYGQADWSMKKSMGVLVAATIFIAWSSETLVGAVEPVLASLGWTEFFMGIVVIPIVGNVAEHLTAVQVAVKNQMDMSMEISIGSSLQVALFVAPVLVFISLLMGHPLTLVFNQFELIALAAASLITALVALDGESNWMEGAQLLVVYIILALAFFFLPA